MAEAFRLLSEEVLTRLEVFVNSYKMQSVTKNPDQSEFQRKDPRHNSRLVQMGDILLGKDVECIKLGRRGRTGSIFSER